MKPDITMHVHAKVKEVKAYMTGKITASIKDSMNIYIKTHVNACIINHAKANMKADMKPNMRAISDAMFKPAYYSQHENMQEAMV